MPDIPSFWERLKDKLVSSLPGDPNYDPYVTPGVSLATPPASPSPVMYKTASPLANFTEEDINKGIDIGMGFSGGGLATKPPPVIGTFHATGSPAEFTRFKLPPPEHDIGVHTTIDPYVASYYAHPKVPPNLIGKVDFMSGTRFDAPNAAGPRIKPVLTDVQNALRYPTDAGKWNEPINVIGGLADAMQTGFKAPRGLLEDMYNIAGSNKTWREQFAPMLQDKGYDALYYPHISEGGPRGKYNTFMAFSPEQVIPRYSPTGERLIAERGIHEPIRNLEGDVPWRIPTGILKNPAETETLRTLPGENTFKWWGEDAPPSGIKSIFDKYQAQMAEGKAKAEAASAKINAEEAQIQAWNKQYKQGKMTVEEYQTKHDQLLGIPPEQTVKNIETKKKYENPEVKKLFKQLDALSKQHYGLSGTTTASEFADAHNKLQSQLLGLLK